MDTPTSLKQWLDSLRVAEHRIFTSARTARRFILSKSFSKACVNSFEIWYTSRAYAGLGDSTSYPGDRPAWSLALKAGFQSIRYAWPKEDINEVLELLARELPAVSVVDSWPEVASFRNALQERQKLLTQLEGIESLVQLLDASDADLERAGVKDISGKTETSRVLKEVEVEVEKKNEEVVDAVAESDEQDSATPFQRSLSRQILRKLFVESAENLRKSRKANDKYYKDAVLEQGRLMLGKEVQEGGTAALLAYHVTCGLFNALGYSDVLADIDHVLLQLHGLDEHRRMLTQEERRCVQAEVDKLR